MVLKKFVEDVLGSENNIRILQFNNFIKYFRILDDW